MARYREIADDLRTRILSGEFRPGHQLPSINLLQQHYNIPGLNTIRQAQALLIEDGLLEAQQGRGVFVLRSRPQPRRTDVLAELRVARDAIRTAITALEKAALSD